MHPVATNQQSRRRFRSRSGPRTPDREHAHAAADDRANTSERRTRRRSRSSAFAATSIIQKAPQLPRPARVLQFPQRLGLDLADALAGDRELLADLFERMVGVHADAEAHALHPLLARG